MDEFPIVLATSLIGRAYEVLNKPLGGRLTDDELISLRQIMASITSAYAYVLREDLRLILDRGEALDPQTAVPYGPLALEDAPDECGGANCGIKRVRMPQMGRYGGKIALFSFGADAAEFVPAENKQQAIAKARPKPMQRPTPAYYRKGPYAYVVLPPLLSEICLVYYLGIPVNPMELCDNEEDCDIWEEGFPIAPELWHLTKRVLAGEDITELMRGRAYKDRVNNAASADEHAEK